MRSRPPPRAFQEAHHMTKKNPALLLVVAKHYLVFGLLFVGFFSFGDTTAAAEAMITPLHTRDNFNNKNVVENSPLTILVHGLDSSSKTWIDTMHNLNTPCLAVDQRGSGYTPLGDPSRFSQDALIEDLHDIIVKTKRGDDEKVVLVGHSLGGRIVIGYAATYPEHIAALVIEDMDIAPRTPDANGLVQLEPYSGVFERQRESKQAVIEALKEVGYPPEFIEKGLATGRIEPSPFVSKKDSSTTTTTTSSSPIPYWSHINPDFRKLCYQHVLSTTQSNIDCTKIAKLFQHQQKEEDDDQIGRYLFPCHVMVAGEDGTVCIEDSIEEMKSILGEQLSIHRYPTAGHSIHSTAAKEFLTTLQSIIDSAR